jgi:uridine kinase
VSQPVNATPSRFEDIVAAVAAHDGQPRTMVAIDGGDGSGKTTFAARLSDALSIEGRQSVVIHVDDFMHVRSVRHRRGRHSPEGYLDDSYDYESLAQLALRPLGASGDGWFRAGCVDRDRDTPTTFPRAYAGPGTVVIVEGLFLLRDELAGWWDLTIFLDVALEVALGRKEHRDGLTIDDGTALATRYVEGHRTYRSRYRPHARATWVLTDPVLDDRSSGPPSES